MNATQVEADAGEARSAGVSADAPLLQARGLERGFDVKAGLFSPTRRLKAVNGVDLTLARGEVLGIVGESGCGKSTLARMLLGLLPPNAGSVQLGGEDMQA